MTKTCFIISTIGKEGEDAYKISTQKLKFVFEPVLEKLGYEVKRADGEDIPGSISRKIVERIITSELAIADISDLNANVFYELAIRNAVNKPVILVRNPGQALPFDIKDIRAISVDMKEPEIWQDAKIQLEKYVKEAENNPTKASESIVSDFMKSFQITKDAKDDPQQEILRELKDLASEVRRNTLQRDSSRITIHGINDPIGFQNQPSKNLISGDIIPGNTQTEVKCKTCGRSFLIQIPPPTLYTVSPRIISQTCPICFAVNVYTF